MESETKETAAANVRRRRAKRAYLILGGIAFAVAGGWFIHRELTKGKQTTDDAQVESDVVPLAARVSGVIKATRVHDNQLVKAGDVLFEIDPSDLDIEVARTEAELEIARAHLATADAQVAIVQSSSTGGLSSARAALTGAGASVRSAADSVRAAEAAVEKARTDLANADTDLGRAKQLFEKEAITKRELERAQQVHDVAKAALDSASAQLDEARAQHGLAQSRVAEAQGHVAQNAPVDAQVAAAQAVAKAASAQVTAAEVACNRAKLQRTYASVTAPVSGTISKLGAHPGQAIMAGQTLLMLVPTETYVVANFKESQVGGMNTGDTVDIELDAYPGTTLHGVVDTVSPATGSRFSTIPPDNATGNFVKVVQRVPVKITWTTPPAFAMRPGLSADVTVHVGN